MASDNARRERATQFDLKAVDDVAEWMQRLNARFEGVAKYMRDNNVPSPVTVDGGKGIYDLLRAAVALVNKLQAAAEDASLPKPVEEREGEPPINVEPDPAPGIDGTKKPKAKR